MARSLTATDLARRIGVDEWTVIRWERGTASPMPGVTVQLIDLLRIPRDRWEQRAELNGAKPPKSLKLSTDDILEIRRAHESGEQLARTFGVDRAMISRIRNGERWNSVAEDGSVRRRRSLRAPEVRAIRDRLAAGRAPDVIAQEHGTVLQQIEGIRDGEIYAWVKPHKVKRAPRGKPFSGPGDPRYAKRRKLTKEEVIEIKQSIDVGYADRELGRIYGVNQATIWSIRKGKTWAWLTEANGNGAHP